MVSARDCMRLVVVALCCAVVAACDVAPTRPDLSRLYRIGVEPADITPVIVIPGVFGSKLRDRTTGAEVWPGPWSTILGSDYRNLALDFDRETLAPKPDNLEAFGLAERVLGQNFYGPILDTLRQFGGYVQATPGTPMVKRERRYYIFAYDWRQDNIETARALDRLIEAIRIDYADPNLKVDLVAHSMGGLVARYYLRYGPDDVLDASTDHLVTLYGTSRVRKLILLGTPNMGSASSLHAFLIGEPIGLKRISPETLATMPGGYQLFPHPLVTWLINTKGQALDANLFDPALWQELRWSIYDPAAIARIRSERGADADAHLAALQRYFALRLERARRFVWSLTTPEPATPIRYVLFGGDCTLTPARLLLEEDNGVWVARLNPADVRQRATGIKYEDIMLEPGDGRVTKPSLLARESLDPSAPQSEDAFLPVAYWFFLCEQHDQLTGNVNFQDNLLNVLLTRNLPWEMPTPAP